MGFRTERDLARLALPEGKPEAFFADARGSGLYVRVQRGGRPTFVVRYSFGGKRAKVTLAPVAALALEDARREAGRIVAAARKGRDPAADRREARATAKAPLPEVLTVVGLISRYLRDAEARQRPRTFVETRRYLARDSLPLHALPAAELSRRDVSALLLDLAAASGPVAANRCRAALSAAYAWAMRAGIVDHNPMVGSVRADERARSRVLSVAEIGAVWGATSSLDAHDRVVRLLLLTGARRAEVGGMHEGEVDRERGLWLLPASRVKNGRPHEVPLPRQALDLLPEANGAFLFGRGGKAPFSGWSQSKARLDARIAALRGEPMAEWHLHDLRRSTVTNMAEIGIEPHIIEAVVNHASGHKAGVAGTYNHAAYRQPKREALQRWADWLLAEVAGGAPGRVVPLRRRG
jgi:integrase